MSATDSACPQCGSALDLVSDGEVDGRPAPFLACTGCEFCVEVTLTLDADGFAVKVVDEGETL